VLAAVVYLQTKLEVILVLSIQEIGGGPTNWDIRGFTTMRYINRLFTYLLIITYILKVYRNVA